MAARELRTDRDRVEPHADGVLLVDHECLVAPRPREHRHARDARRLPNPGKDVVRGELVDVRHDGLDLLADPIELLAERPVEAGVGHLLDDDIESVSRAVGVADDEGERLLELVRAPDGGRQDGAVVSEDRPTGRDARVDGEPRVLAQRPSPFRSVARCALVMREMLPSFPSRLASTSSSTVPGARKVTTTGRCLRPMRRTRWRDWKKS